MPGSGNINSSWTLNEAPGPQCNDIGVPTILFPRFHQAVEHAATGSCQLHLSRAFQTEGAGHPTPLEGPCYFELHIAILYTIFSGTI